MNHQHQCKNCSQSFACFWQPESRRRYEMYERQHKEEICYECARQLCGVYSVCRAGLKGFYWVAWTTIEASWDGEDPCCVGYAVSFDEALDAARAVAVNRFEPVQHPNGTASNWRRIEHLRNKKSRPSNDLGVQIDEFIHHHIPAHMPHDETYIVGHSCHPHLIVKRTRKFVFVIDECDPRERFAYRTAGVEIPHKTIRIDRVRLEAGEQIGDRWWSGYYSISETAPPDAKRECPTHLRGTLDFFRLPWPCTRKEAASAYRRLSQEHHPDSGGSHEAFIELTDQYDRLRAGLTMN